MKTDDIKQIVDSAIRACLPDQAVKRALDKLPENQGKRILIAIGKAAYRMAQAAIDGGVHFDQGLVITKYDHAEGSLPGVEIMEAGHPVVDHNSIAATKKALDLVRDLSQDDLVVFLISGGGSALFEDPLIPMSEFQQLNQDLLASGANIVEMNTIRKRLSNVKAGRFAQHCYPAQVYSVVLSDVIGDPIDMIASGPAYPDSSTTEEALELIERYGISLSPQAREILDKETPKVLTNVETVISGSVTELAKAGQQELEKLGFETTILTTSMSCEAREAGFLMGSIGRTHAHRKDKLAFILGGETVVTLRGSGKGGRNQEIALAAARDIEGLDNVRIFSFGSDGTDGPTDAAGGMSDGETITRMIAEGWTLHKALVDNDAYHALKAIDQLIMTGPTGTNVNDLSVILIN